MSTCNDKVFVSSRIALHKQTFNGPNANSRKCHDIKAEPLSQLTTCGLMGTDDFILAEMSAMKSASVALATSCVMVWAATTRP